MRLVVATNHQGRHCHKQGGGRRRPGGWPTPARVPAAPHNAAWAGLERWAEPNRLLLPQQNGTYLDIQVRPSDCNC